MKSIYFYGKDECFYHKLSGFMVLCITQYFVLIRLISTWRVPFRPSKSFNFPKREFGSKGEKRIKFSCRMVSFAWLHYDISEDVAFCYLRMKCQLEKRFLASYEAGSSLYLQRIYLLQGRHGFILIKRRTTPTVCLLFS